MHSFFSRIPGAIAFIAFFRTRSTATLGEENSKVSALKWRQRKRQLKIALAKPTMRLVALCMSGALIAFCADYALAKGISDSTLRTESPVATPNVVVHRPGEGPDFRNNYSLSLISLQCHSTSAGGSNPDKISLYVTNNNQLVWGPSSINAGQTVSIPLGQTVFKNTVTVELRDQSGSLGSVPISSVPSEVHRSEPFISGTASYTLTYYTQHLRADSQLP